MGSAKVRLLDKFKAQKARSGPSCSVSRTLNALPEHDRVDLVAALADESISATTISEVLKGEGVTVSADMLRRHRKQRCACE